MKDFEVYVTFKGDVRFRIQADNENEAWDMVENTYDILGFADLNDLDINDVDIVDVWEVKEH